MDSEASQVSAVSQVPTGSAQPAAANSGKIASIIYGKIVRLHNKGLITITITITIRERF